MAKYELIKKTEVDGSVWYKIDKDGMHVNESYTRDLGEAQKHLEELVNGTRLSEPMFKTLKTIVVDEN